MIYFDLFFTFLKIGLFTIGGGYAMLPMIREEVSSHGWLSQSELIDFIAVSESTPGPFAVNIATFVGTRTGGIFGGLCATLGVVLPSFVIILQACRRCDERLETGCGRLDSGGTALAFGHGVLSAGFERECFRRSAVLRFARYICRGGRAGV